MDKTIRQLEIYIKKGKGRLITVVSNSTDNIMINRTAITTIQKWVGDNFMCISHSRWRGHEWKRTDLREKTKYLQIAVRNNAIRTIYITAKIDNNQKNSKCVDRDKTITRITSKSVKLAQGKFKTRHGWVGKVLHLELCKKFRFDHTTKWYMHIPEYI